ncbi:hypothetical protein GCM10010433_06680 [Streptomyces pulveraceus]
MVAWEIGPQGVQGQLRVIGVRAGDLETTRNAQDAARAVRLDVLKGMQGHR